MQITDEIVETAARAYNRACAGPLSLAGMRAALEAALSQSAGGAGQAERELSEMRAALEANAPFAYDPATGFLQADDGGTGEHCVFYVPAGGAGQEGAERLYDADEPMADGEVRMTAAENVLGWLLIEKIGVPDDRNYTPNEAQDILARRLEYASDLENERSAVSPAPAGVQVKVLDFFTNVDNWGASEWFDRLAKAIREQDKAVVAGDDIGVETYRNIAASSAMRLVRDYEAEVRSALTAPRATAEAAKIADAIEKADWSGPSIGNKLLLQAAVSALRSTIAPPAAGAQAVPVAWRYTHLFNGQRLPWQLTTEQWLAEREREKGAVVEPLFAAPASPVGKER